MNLQGEFPITMDTKGRCILPVALRKYFPLGSGSKFFINKGFENYLNIYPIDEWNKVSEKINKLDDYNPKARKLRRLFMNGSKEVDLDDEYRFLIPKNLQEKVSITKDVILLCVGVKMELWDKEEYDKFYNDNSDDFSELGYDFLSDEKKVTEVVKETENNE